jgi:transposase-like protein
MYPPPPPALSPVQEQVAIALASGSTIAAAARDASISRQTVHNWLHRHSLFSAFVQELRKQYIQSIRARVNLLSDRALSALDRVLADPNMPPAVQVRAALAVLNRNVTNEQGWVLPMPVDSPVYQHGLELVTEMKEDSQRKTIPDSIDLAGIVTEEPTADLTQFDTFRENSVTPPTMQAAIPRSAPCPCGSGEKYKRCCGRAAPPVLSTAAA